MSREKAAKILMMSDVELAIYKAKREQRQRWRGMSHDEWVEYCNKMAEWFASPAHNEFDDYVAANNERKTKSDKLALEAKNVQQ